MVGQKTNYLKCLAILALTIIVEVLLALLFKTRKYHIVALTNLITNIVLQLLIISFNLSWLQFALAEVVIIVVEGVIYLNTLKTNKTMTIIYTILANLITALLTFFV